MVVSTTEARRRRAWEYPECDDCQTDVYVATSNSNVHGYVCHFCGGIFSV